MEITKKYIRENIEGELSHECTATDSMVGSWYCTSYCPYNKNKDIDGFDDTETFIECTN